MNHQDPTRREFLLKVARGAAYSAPLIATFTVAPELLAQQPSLPSKHHMKAPAPSSPAPTEAPGPRPSDKHPPPSEKGGG
jgi:hypothetical protein